MSFGAEISTQLAAHRALTDHERLAGVERGVRSRVMLNARHDFCDACGDGRFECPRGTDALVGHAPEIGKRRSDGGCARVEIPEGEAMMQQEVHRDLGAPGGRW